MSPVLADGCPHEQWCSRCFRSSAGRATARPAATVMDSDYGRKLGFKFRDTVTVTARFKFKVRGLGLGGYEDSDSEAASSLPVDSDGQSPALY